MQKNTSNQMIIISKIFDDEYERTIKERTINENDIIFAGNISELTSSIGKYLFGYLIITKNRFIKVLYDCAKESSLVGGLILGLLTGGLLGGYNDPGRETSRIKYRQESTGHEFVKIPISPLTNNELITKTTHEYTLESLINLQKTDEELLNDKKIIPSFKFTFLPDKFENLILYEDKQGNYVYTYLLDCINRSKMKTSDNMIAGQLEKLIELHQYMIINDEEFEKAKKRLLGN
jgi:hypothetical protein